MKTRKIVFLVSAMEAGGAERVAAELCNGWAAHGSEVVLIATYSGRGACQFSLAAGVRMVYLADEAAVRGRGPLGYLQRFLALRRLLQRESPDVVVSFLTNVNIAAVACSAGLGLPVVVSERVYPPAFPVSLVSGWLRRLLYPVARSVVVQTVESRRWLQTRIPRARGVVIPNPVAYPLVSVEPTVSPSAVLGAERMVVLGVGRLVAQKGFDALLAAFALVCGQHPGWDLVLLGEGPERGALARRAAELGIAARVFLPGRVGNAADWYARSGIYVLSSRFEGFPNSLMEAMAYGCPVVSYDCDTGPRDIISDGENGLLVQPVGDPAPLSRALDRLMSNLPLRQRLASQAVSVRTRFSSEQVLADWDRLFDDVTRSSP